MKRFVMLTMVFVMVLVSFGGCYWGFEGRDRRGGYDRGGGHDDRNETHDRGGDREGGYDERR